jgi:nitrogen fixation-related uncharacterized protein
VTAELVVILLVVTVAFGVLAFWKYVESQQTKDLLESYERVARDSIEMTKSLSDRVQRPWGDSPTETVAADVVAEMDKAWLEAPDSLMPFDDDLAGLSEEYEEL